MKKTLRPLVRARRGSVLIVALLIASIIGISLVSYINVCTNSLKMANRSFYQNAASNLCETGLEEGVWSFNQMGSGVAASTVWSAANGWSTYTNKVAAVTITSGGSGYSTAPTVSFSGGGGSGVAATATISSGIVTGIMITNQGSGFTSAPTVTLTGGGGTGATATATNTGATRALSTVNLDAGATARVQIFVGGYDGTYSTPVVVSKVTVTPADGPTVVKTIEVTLKFNGPFIDGVVAKNGLTWNGHPTADSWNSNPANSPTGPWSTYASSTHNANTTVADLTGAVSLGAQGLVNGTLALGSAATYNNTGTVTGTISHNLDFDFTMPAYPATTNLDHYTNLGASVPATLPGALDQPNTTDGRYYYFASSATITTTIGTGKNITIVGSGNTSTSGTITIPSTSSLYIYTDGSVNATYVNNAWAGALRIYTTTTSGTTISGNDNILACIFAPNSPITGNGGGNSGAFYGSFVGASVTSNGHMDFHYDESLSKIGGSKPWKCTIWREMQSATERSLYNTQLNF